MLRQQVHGPGAWEWGAGLFCTRVPPQCLGCGQHPRALHGGGQGLFTQTTDLYSLPWLPLTAPGVPSWCEGEWGSFPLLQAPEPTWFECLEPLQRSRGECPWVQQCVCVGGGRGSCTNLCSHSGVCVWLRKGGLRPWSSEVFCFRPGGVCVRTEAHVSRSPLHPRCLTCGIRSQCVFVL